MPSWVRRVLRTDTNFPRPSLRIRRAERLGATRKAASRSSAMTAMFPPGGTRFFCAVTGKAIAALNINAAIAVWEANFREVRGVRIGNSFIAENNGAKPVAKTALLPQGWRLYHALKMAAQVVASGFPHSWGP